jgi:UDP:flavonoid glycosyltransferase YjiC (YdhE family)
VQFCGEKAGEAMRFVLASYGSRGDVEPVVVLARELKGRGHDVLVAVPPNLVGFAENAGLTAVACGLDSRVSMDAQREYWTMYFRTPWKFRQLSRMARETAEFASRCWADMTDTLSTSVNGADVLITGLIFEQPAANVAEAHGIPLVTLHYFPARAHGRLLPPLPAALSRLAMQLNDWVAWRGTRAAEDAQRRTLGLAAATGPVPQRIARRGSLEIQAYDAFCFPGLAAEWAPHNTGRPPLRPFVGALALAAPTGADGRVSAWIAQGSAPVFFGFGSVPLQSPQQTIAMIARVCARLGLRAVVGAGGSDFGGVAPDEHVLVVGAVNYATVFPLCRAVVHHGGAGTAAACLRAGVPQLVLWTLPDQPSFAANLRRLKAGVGRRFSATTEKTLTADLLKVLGPECVARAGVVAQQMSTVSGSAVAAADCVEEYARAGSGALDR